MTKTVADILNEAADLIEPEGAWIQGELAKNAEGKVYKYGVEEDAVCFCVEGALEMAGDGHQAFAALQEFLGEDSLYLWNDRAGRTQAEVVAALREAAKKAEGQ